MNQDVLERVFEHAKVVDEWCAKNGGIRVMTALFGSQNYGLATSKSDVDTKSIIVPELRDWTWGDTEKYNRTLVLDNGEHAETKCLHDMCKQYIKGNINFLETLYTDYVDVAPGWEWFYNILAQARDNISRHNLYRSAKCWLGYESQALERTFFSDSVALGYNEAVGYNPKSLMNAFRIKESFIRFFQFNRPFDEAIDVSDMRGILVDVKEHPMDRDIAWMFASDLRKWMDKAHEWVRQTYTDKEVFNADFFSRMLCEEVYVTLGENEFEPERPMATWQKEVGDWPNSNLSALDV